MRASMAGSGVAVVRKGNNITLAMPGSITFATNSADLNADFYPILDKVSTDLNQYDLPWSRSPATRIRRSGVAYNQALSERRAKSVAAYLTSRGVRAERLIVVGDGENHPIASNDTPAGRQQNRRVELTIVPVEKSS